MPTVIILSFYRMVKGCEFEHCDFYSVCFSSLGECMCALYAKGMYLLPVVSGEVPQLSKSGTVIKYIPLPHHG